jgi:hypothetical protein
MMERILNETKINVELRNGKTCCIWPSEILEMIHIKQLKERNSTVSLTDASTLMP